MRSSWRNRAQLALLSLALPLLQGCAAVEHQQRYAETSSPERVTASLCRLGPSADLMRLAPGTECLVLVHANEWLTRVPVRVEKGDRYRFSFAGEQFWYDAGERVTSPAGVPGHGLKSLGNFLKRNPEAAWFALIAATVAPGNLEDTEFEAHDVGRETDTRFEQAGQLAMYPNDASGPPLFRHYFYSNNHGRIWVRVERR